MTISTRCSIASSRSRPTTCTPCDSVPAQRPEAVNRPRGRSSFDFLTTHSQRSIMITTQETTTHGLFQGLVVEDGRAVSNWGLSRSTRPAVYLEPVSYADVQTAVREAQRFPSPIHPVGSM